VCERGAGCIQSKNSYCGAGSGILHCTITIDRPIQSWNGPLRGCILESDLPCGRERGRSGGTAGGLGGASGGGETELQLQKRRIGVRLKALKRKLDEVTHNLGPLIAGEHPLKGVYKSCFTL
jgi:hypothetical protein